MTDDNHDTAVLVQGVTTYEAQMIKLLLRDVGIPCLYEGPDLDGAYLGRAAHDNVQNVDVLVPAVALKDARARLAEAWGEDGLPPKAE